MRKLKVFVSALAVTLACSTMAQAACKQSHINNKTWKISAYEAKNGLSIFCTFRTSGSGSIASTPGGCDNSTIASGDLSTAAPFDILSGSVTAVPGQSCTFDAALNLANSNVLKARVVMESGKTVANGNFVLTGGQGGPISMMRQ